MKVQLKRFSEFQVGVTVSYVEGLPGVLGNKGTLAKYQRECEPIFREQGNETLQVGGRKHC